MIENNDPRVHKLLSMLEEKECTKMELKKALNLTDYQLDNLIVVMSYRYPIYEENAVYGVLVC